MPNEIPKKSKAEVEAENKARLQANLNKTALKQNEINNLPKLSTAEETQLTERRAAVLIKLDEYFNNVVKPRYAIHHGAGISGRSDALGGMNNNYRLCQQKISASPNPERALKYYVDQERDFLTSALIQRRNNADSLNQLLELKGKHDSLVPSLPAEPSRPSVTLPSRKELQPRFKSPPGLEELRTMNKPPVVLDAVKLPTKPEFEISSSGSSNPNIQPGILSGDEIKHGSPQKLKTGPIEKDPKLLIEGEVDAKLAEHKRLINHYGHWSKLAEVSWSEFSKVAQIIQNCVALSQQLHTQYGTEHQLKPEGIEGYEKMQTALHNIHGHLSNLRATGPQETMIFGNKITDSAEIKAALKKITNEDVDLDQFKDKIVMSSTTDNSVFVQGLKNGRFVSEAYITPAMNADDHMLRKLVHEQIESARADPRILGQALEFSGNYTKEYLNLAISYCQRCGYACQVDKTLQDKLINQTVDPAEKRQLENLYTQNVIDIPKETEWQDWLKANAKYPFSDLLSAREQKALESSFGLPPLPAALKNAEELEVAQLAKGACATHRTDHIHRAPASAPSNLNPTIHVSAANDEEEEKEEDQDVISMQISHNHHQ